ncbi:hypothetical protein GGQ85_004509 [Nitrobacter vulgaris]|nr:hypothetical protein [Nitrobacter vulgaris]
MQDFIGGRRLAWVSGRTGTSDAGKAALTGYSRKYNPETKFGSGAIRCPRGGFRASIFPLRIACRQWMLNSGYPFIAYAPR